MLSLVDNTEEVARLGDQELIESLQRLLAQERSAHARLLVHIAEVDARGIYRERAYSSMFDYCVQALHMSEAEAYLRIRAARLSREFPRVLDMLAAGELHLSALKLLAPALTPHNADELLEASRFKSKRDLEVLLAARLEKPDVPSTLRKLPQARPAPVAEANLPLRSKRPNRRRARFLARRAQSPPKSHGSSCGLRLQPARGHRSARWGLAATSCSSPRVRRCMTSCSRRAT